jgi:hypothetical protein
MTKKYFLRSLLILPIIALLVNSPLSPAQDNGAATKPGFDQVADRALQAMKARAEELKIKGVAVVAYAPGDTVQSWSSKMVVVGNLRTPTTEKDKGNNLLGIAYSKASEMAETLKDSGSGVRPPLTGEFGWQGGVTAKGKAGRLICAFSGGASAQDVQVSKVGLAILAEQF